MLLQQKQGRSKSLQPCGQARAMALFSVSLIWGQSFTWTYRRDWLLVHETETSACTRVAQVSSLIKPMSASMLFWVAAELTRRLLDGIACTLQGETQHRFDAHLGFLLD
eukprot:4943910-Amphidinium_carterae.1